MLNKTFERKTIDREFLGDLLPLLKRHHTEIAADLGIPFNPDFEKYLGMEKAGLLRCFTVRIAGDLVGYAVFFVHQNLHHSTSLWAVQDVLFLEKSLRRQGIGREFIDWCDSQLREEGVQMVIHLVRDFADFSPTLKKLGYSRIETAWGRRLDKAS